MTTAFVLSGGASLGSIQVGMLKSLEAAGIIPDVIVGTSVGAVNGAWIAGEYSAASLDGLAGLWRSMSRAKVFPADPLTGIAGVLGRRDHLVPPRRFRRLIREHIKFPDLELAGIPFHTVSSDVLTGRSVRLSAGPAVDAIAASAAIPGIFPPVPVGGRLLIDGGAVQNLPIREAVSLGANTVWVLPTGASCPISRPPHSALEMMLRGLQLALNAQMAAEIESCQGLVDLRLVPPLCPVAVNPADFSQAADLMRRAEQETADWLAGEAGFAGQERLLVPHRHPVGGDN
ncbi:patatin-like phospholipase family protein [Tomitella biformata]|uniref:patatin-like phospholipase family protein n=1 Tax=Tomitella biformata TaxID=630403 RepID=UPI0004673652|nr:patatin-like phospholipase family protein [Tomitella biformata]